jgi:hypothetical protein
MNELTDLQAQIARQHELLEYFAPAYMKDEVAALWAEICALMGVEAEQLAMEKARECQAGLPAEFWSPV